MSGVLLTKLEAFVDPIDRKLRGPIRAHTWIDGCAGNRGYRNNCTYATKMLDEMMDHEKGAFDVGLLQNC